MVGCPRIRALAVLLDLVAGVVLGVYARVGDVTALGIVILGLCTAVALSILAFLTTPMPDWWHSFSKWEKLGKIPGGLLADSVIRAFRIGGAGVLAYLSVRLMR